MKLQQGRMAFGSIGVHAFQRMPVGLAIVNNLEVVLSPDCATQFPFCSCNVMQQLWSEE